MAVKITSIDTLALSKELTSNGLDEMKSIELAEALSQSLRVSEMQIATIIDIENLAGKGSPLYSNVNKVCDRLEDVKEAIIRQHAEIYPLINQVNRKQKRSMIAIASANIILIAVIVYLFIIITYGP
jgi:hypothetical protein